MEFLRLYIGYGLLDIGLVLVVSGEGAIWGLDLNWMDEFLEYVLLLRKVI